MLPIIDFSDFRVGDARRRRAVAAEVGAILEEIGFFYIRGHGIAEATIQAARSAIETFFACSEAEKRAYQRRPRRYRGYLPPIPFNEASATEARAPILYEAFILGPDVTRDDPTVAASRGLVSPTPWPVEPLTFRAAVTTYRDAVDHLALALLRAFALSLDAPEEAIVRHFRQPLTNTSLLHYLPRPIVDGGEDGEPTTCRRTATRMPSPSSPPARSAGSRCGTGMGDGSTRSPYPAASSSTSGP